ncbi:hypothetical protein KVR01_008925 [Diaporthe batatas]|uniref:uncharacterized protein n=1 Tax=Diaporthe batatas TaxID=748121 RepID=UPI001D04C71F|nr:uncharacterized protein KVR01_008925 [Diaporthe batatas]KAG8160661.1 hypothetical protein KVR01_008925 [Diaporthe batatas]
MEDAEYVGKSTRTRIYQRHPVGMAKLIVAFVRSTPILCICWAHGEPTRMEVVAEQQTLGLRTIPSLPASFKRQAQEQCGLNVLLPRICHQRCVVDTARHSGWATLQRYASSTSPLRGLESKSGKPVSDLEPARRVLRETFGHRKFRPEQEEVIPRLLSGESMAISWPSKSGASICYLVPAVLESLTVNHGITIVIRGSDTLLRRKAETLRDSGIPVDAVYSVYHDESLLKTTRKAALDRVRAGKTRILYLLAKDSADRDVLEAIESALDGVYRIVVEDASYFTTLETHEMTYDVANYLKGAGLSVGAIIEEPTTHRSKELLSRFEASEFDVLCTTISAAELIEHTHVRNVVIASMPSSVSAVYREMRVAGRDGGWSKAFLVLDTVGMYQSETGKRAALPCRHDIRSLLNKIFFKEPTKQTIHIDRHKLGWELDMKFTRIYEILEGLQDQLGLISVGDQEYGAYRYAYSRRGFDLKKSASPIDMAIVANSTKSGDFYYLNFQGARGQIESFSRSEAINRLNQMSGLGHMTVRPWNMRLELRILKRPSLGNGPGSIRAVEEWMYTSLQRGLEAWKQSRREVVELFTKDRCTSVGLAEYFGTELPGGRTRCERCDWCLTGKPLVLPPGIAEDEIDRRRVIAVLHAVPDRSNPRFLARLAYENIFLY